MNPFNRIFPKENITCSLNSHIVSSAHMDFTTDSGNITKAQLPIDSAVDYSDLYLALVNDAKEFNLIPPVADQPKYSLMYPGQQYLEEEPSIKPTGLRLIDKGRSTNSKLFVIRHDILENYLATKIPQRLPLYELSRSGRIHLQARGADRPSIDTIETMVPCVPFLAGDRIEAMPFDAALIDYIEIFSIPYGELEGTSLSDLSGLPIMVVFHQFKHNNPKHNYHAIFFSELINPASAMRIMNGINMEKPSTVCSSVHKFGDSPKDIYYLDPKDNILRSLDGSNCKKPMDAIIFQRNISEPMPKTDGLIPEFLSSISSAVEREIDHKLYIKAAVRIIGASVRDKMPQLLFGNSKRYIINITYTTSIQVPLECTNASVIKTMGPLFLIDGEIQKLARSIAQNIINTNQLDAMKARKQPFAGNLYTGTTNFPYKEVRVNDVDLTYRPGTAIDPGGSGPYGNGTADPNSIPYDQTHITSTTETDSTDMDIDWSTGPWSSP